MIELFIAFGAGLISFLSPCVLPLIPGYISFISGASLNELLTKKKINLLPLILFSLGFSFVFIIFGAAASFLGQILLQNSQTLRIVAGLIIILFSLQLLGIFNISFVSEELDNFEISVFDAFGKQIFIEEKQNFIGEYTKQIDLFDYKKGVYLVHIRTNNSFTSKRIVFQ